MRKFSLGATVSVAAIAAAVAVSLTYLYAMDRFNTMVADVNERQAMYQKISEIDQKVRQDYAGTIDEGALNDGIAAGYLSGLGDAYGEYLPAERYRAYLAGETSGAGLGVRTVRDADGNMEVTEVPAGSAGEACGLMPGDVITAVDGREVVRSGYVEAAASLDGAAGSTVTLTVLRPAGEDGDAARLELTATRAAYRRAVVSASVIQGNAGYVKISDFTGSAAEDFAAALEDLRAQGVCGLVIDLRNNTGSGMEAMAEMLDALLPAGNTVSSRAKDGSVTVEFTSNAAEYTQPLSVIVNEGTSGAAEAFAAAVQDFKKGMAVGAETPGRGVKQEVTPLSDGSAIVLSVGEYLRPNGETLLGQGVTPEIGVALTAEQAEALLHGTLPVEEDPQVQSAVTALIRQGAQVQQAPGAEPEEEAAEPSGAESSGTESSAADASGTESSTAESSGSGSEASSG